MKIMGLIVEDVYKPRCSAVLRELWNGNYHLGRVREGGIYSQAQDRKLPNLI